MARRVGSASTESRFALTARNFFEILLSRNSSSNRNGWFSTLDILTLCHSEGHIICSFNHIPSPVNQVLKPLPMLPATVRRVPEHTAEHVNEEIRRQTERNVARYAATSPEAIDRRLEELEREWDIERTLEANAATAMLVGLTLGATVDRKWFIFPAFVAGFLLQHALQGWCPPLPVFRRLGVRTQSEIDEEKHALKALRGDFKRIGTSGAKAAEADGALEAARR